MVYTRSNNEIEMISKSCQIVADTLIMIEKHVFDASLPLSHHELFVKTIIIASMGDRNDDMVPKVLAKCELKCGEHGLEGMTHPWVVAIPNYQEAVDLSSASQELNNASDVVGVFIVRIVQTRRIDDDTLRAILYPEASDFSGLFGARASFTADFEPSS